MRRLTAGLVVIGLVALVGRADDTPAPKKSLAYDDAPAPNNSPAFGAMKKELTEAQAKHAKELKDAQKAVRDGKTDAETQEAQKKLADITKDLPGPKYAVRFLEFAEQHPEDPIAFAAALACLGRRPPHRADSACPRTSTHPTRASQPSVGDICRTSPPAADNPCPYRASDARLSSE